MTRILPLLMATLTQHPRHSVPVEWDKNVWSANLFRAWERIFWRRSGPNGGEDTIRAECATWIHIDETGRCSVRRQFYTVESFTSHVECTVRGYFKSLTWKETSPRMVQMAFVFGAIVLSFKMPHHLLPMVGMAIAVDVESNGTTAGTSPITFSHTSTGSNLAAVVTPFGTATAAIAISVPTYGGSATTIIGAQELAGATRPGCAMYMALPPATGAQTVSCAFSGSGFSANAVCVSYSGIKQTAQPDASGGGTSISTGTPTVTITPVAANCWVMAVAGGTLTAPNHTARGALITIGGVKGEYQDTNGTVTAGVGTVMSWTGTSGPWCEAAGSLSPAAVVFIAPISLFRFQAINRSNTY